MSASTEGAVAEDRPSFGEWLKAKRAEPIVITVQRYKCPHCGTSRSKRAAARAHITRCFRNPDARSCKTCVYFEQGGDPDVGIPAYEQCEALGINLEFKLRSGCPEYAEVTE